MRMRQAREIDAEIAQIRKSLDKLGRAFTSLKVLLDAIETLKLSGATRKTTAPAPAGTGATSDGRSVSDKGMQTWKLGGQFLGHLRRFSPRERTYFKQLRREKGYEVAIAAMQKAKAQRNK